MDAACGGRREMQQGAGDAEDVCGERCRRRRCCFKGAGAEFLGREGSGRRGGTLVDCAGERKIRHESGL